MAFKLKSNFKIILAGCSMSIFTLGVVFSSSLAWFTSNRTVNNANEAMKILNTNRSLVSFKLYDVIQPTDSDNEPLPISDDATSFSFYNVPSCTITYDYEKDEPVISGEVTLDLGTYSLLDSIHPVLGIFEIEDNYASPSVEKPFYLKASTQENYVAELDNNGDFINMLNNENNPLSSIISFESFSLDNLSSITNGNTFEITKSRLSTSTKTEFVTFDEDRLNPTFNKNITLFNSTSGSVKYVCVVFNYFDASINYIYSSYIGYDVIQGTVGGETTIPFFCDFSFQV